MAANTPASPPNLTISRMALTDFSEMMRPRNRYGGDLTTAPIAPLCWPVADGDEVEATRRLEYSTLRERKFFQVDPTCHTLKVCAPNGKILSFARWNFFPEGYDFDKHELVDVYEFLPPGASDVFKIELFRSLRTGMMKLRQEWMKKGPCWGRLCFRSDNDLGITNALCSSDVHGDAAVLQRSRCSEDAD